VIVYTAGDWYSKPEQQDEFVRRWHERCKIAVAEIDSEGWNVLLRDKEDSRHYVSLGAFHDEIAFVTWRDGDGLKNHLAELSEVLEHAETSLFEVVASVGPQVLTP